MEATKLSRRAFLGTTVVSGFSRTVVSGFSGTPVRLKADTTCEKADTTYEFEEQSPPAADWVDRPMRWAQLTLVENDPGRYDPRFWLEYFDRIHADAACLSAGGVVAYYPTNVPLHHRSAWMKASDPFGELFAGCRARGMAVIARTDPHAAHQDVYDAHPDWIAVDAEGR